MSHQGTPTSSWGTPGPGNGAAGPFRGSGQAGGSGRFNGPGSFDDARGVPNGAPAWQAGQATTGPAHPGNARQSHGAAVPTPTPAPPSSGWGNGAGHNSGVSTTAVGGGWGAPPRPAGGSPFPPPAGPNAGPSMSAGGPGAPAPGSPATFPGTPGHGPLGSGPYGQGAFGTGVPPARRRRGLPGWGWALSVTAALVVLILAGWAIGAGVSGPTVAAPPTTTPASTDDLVTSHVSFDERTTLDAEPIAVMPSEHFEPGGVYFGGESRQEVYGLIEYPSCHALVESTRGLDAGSLNDREATVRLIDNIVANGASLVAGPDDGSLATDGGGTIDMATATLDSNRGTEHLFARVFAGSGDAIMVSVGCDSQGDLSGALGVVEQHVALHIEIG